MPQNRLQNSLMKPLAALAYPGMYLVYKYNQFKRQQQESAKKKVTEKELQHLNHKIDKLLAKLDEHETTTTTPPTPSDRADVNGNISEEEECVVCLSAKATMQTFPCGHRVVCRKCFVKTIQVAVSQRCLPLKCVVCRSRILKLKQSGDDPFTPPPTRHPLFQVEGSRGSGSKLPKASSLARQLFATGRSASPSRRPDNSAHRAQPTSTKLMQPLLIYPSQTSPKQHRAFMSDSPLGGAGSSSSTRFPGASGGGSKHSQHRAVPRHISSASQSSHLASPLTPIRQRLQRDECRHNAAMSSELRHSHLLSPRVSSRCTHCSPHMHPSPRPATINVNKFIQQGV